jgi:hypothetical protein
MASMLCVFLNLFMIQQTMNFALDSHPKSKIQVLADRSLSQKCSDESLSHAFLYHAFLKFGKDDEKIKHTLCDYESDVSNHRICSIRGGGGQRKLIRLRAERRQEAEALKSKPLTIPPRYRAARKSAASSAAVSPTFEEQARLQGAVIPDWKLAELRLRSMRDAPWERPKPGDDGDSRLTSDDDNDHGPKAPDLWAEAAGAVPEQVAEWDEDPEDVEDAATLRRVNDGKGNINFKAVDIIPANLTDINDRLAWVQENFLPSNRWITMEDLVEEQRATATERADDVLTRALRGYAAAHVNASLLLNGAPQRLEDAMLLEKGSEEDMATAVAMEEALREVIGYNPAHCNALAAYGMILMDYHGDAVGAEVPRHLPPSPRRHPPTHTAPPPPHTHNAALAHAVPHMPPPPPPPWLPAAYHSGPQWPCSGGPPEIGRPWLRRMCAPPAIHDGRTGWRGSCGSWRGS